MYVLKTSSQFSLCKKFIINLELVRIFPEVGGSDDKSHQSFSSSRG